MIKYGLQEEIKVNRRSGVILGIALIIFLVISIIGAALMTVVMSKARQTNDELAEALARKADLTMKDARDIVGVLFRLSLATLLDDASM